MPEGSAGSAHGGVRPHRSAAPVAVAPPRRRRAARAVLAGLVLAGLVLSALALALAPALMPPSYSWIAHTTSESAAQGIGGAWLARLGFVLFGGSVIVLAGLARDRWGRVASGAHLVFGACMLGAAAFSTRPWTGAPYDRAQDLLHSVAATAMGFAFAAGVIAAALAALRRYGRPPAVLDIAAVVASVAIPLAMSAWPGAAGVSQRVMFAVAYSWYAAAAAGILRRGGRALPTSGDTPRSAIGREVP